MRSTWLGAVALASAAAVAGCGTLADHGGGQAAMPNAGAGPFRELATREIGLSRVAPYALKDDSSYPRDAAVLDLDGDAATLPVWAYVARTEGAQGQDPAPADPPNQIVRHVSSDGRTLARNFDVVLEPSSLWEGDTVGAPAVLRIGAEVWLYYAAAGGIGVATSHDGLHFSPVGDAAVLAPDLGGWEQGATPTNPAVVRLPDGRYQMFYEIVRGAGSSAIGVAESDDGMVWQRVGDQAILAPSEAGTPEAPAYDDLQVGSPMVLLSSSTAGRLIERLYYGATASDGRQSVGMAARFGVEGPFERAAAPVFGSSGSLGPQQPWVVRFEAFTLLFCTERAGRTEAQDYPSVAVGVAPADVTLPPPVDP